MDLMSHFLIAALASWRIAHLVARESGPGGIFLRARERFPRNWFRSALSCVKCAGLWSSLPFVMFVGGELSELVAVWLGLAGAVALLEESTKPPFELRESDAHELLQIEPPRSVK